MSIDQKVGSVLNDAVKKEVDSWEVSIIKANGEHAKYELMVKPVLYGMGTVLVQTGVDLYIANRQPFERNYLTLGFREAVTEFKRDYLVAKYVESGFDAKKTAQLLGLGGNPESGRVMVHQLASQLGMGLAQIKDDPQRYINRFVFKIKDEEVTSRLEEDLKKYGSMVDPALFRKLITKHSIVIAQRFTGIAKKIVQGYD